MPLDEFGPDMLVATDYTQDLLVGVDRRIADCRCSSTTIAVTVNLAQDLDDGSDFQVQIGSLGSGTLGHPSAFNAILRLSALDRYVEHQPALASALRIYSEYIFLMTFVDDMGPYELQVQNWMTGTLVWVSALLRENGLLS